MLNCSTCHRKRDTSHFYRYQYQDTHKPWLPTSPLPEDIDALAQLRADGIVSATPGRTTQRASRANMARVSERLASGERPSETEDARARREAAQQAAQREREAQERTGTVMKWGAGLGAIGVVILGGWRLFKWLGA